MNKSLFDPMELGNISLKNRIVMAPMTRSRADANGVPSEFAIEYYKQRSQAGLIIAEGTSPSINGCGYPRVPGIYHKDQMQRWKQIVQAVHDEGGKIFIQLMHVGRVAHSFNKPSSAETVAPSAVKAAGQMYTDRAGLQEMPTPRALSIEEIPQVIEEYKQATINAFEVGFDGVELHAASGYLPMQFMSTNTNLRKDQYGGSVENRVRFVTETLQAMCSVRGSDKIGIRIWPGSEFNDVHDSHPAETYTELLKKVGPLKLAYVHVIRSPDPHLDSFKLVRDNYKGTIIINGGFDCKMGQDAIQNGQADLISYGSLYLANPDLTERFKKNAPLNAPDPKTFYTPGPQGYVDYPFLKTYKN
jgi:N-ethylmaleimide reductase